MRTSQSLRTQIDDLIAAQAWQAARALLLELWTSEPNAAAASFVVSRFERLREKLPFTGLRVALLRSFTLEPALPLLRASAFAAGIDVTARLGDFNAYAQEMLDAGSWLYQFAPNVLILAVQAGDVAPELSIGYADLDTSEVSRAVERTGKQFANWIRAFRARSQASVIVHSLEMPADPVNGVFDMQAEAGQADAIRAINEHLRKLAREYRGVYVLDYDALVARFGRTCWRDERKWLTVRMPIAAANWPHLVREWMRFLQPLSGRVAKAIVTDLDNTLWQGVIGEDGIAGIRVGTEHPGAAYRAVQRALLDLRARGIMLAVASKNNPVDAMEVFEKHPGMLLRPQHFSAFRANWNSKPQSLSEIAAELNIGIDSLAFIDDNPAERQLVSNELPEVTVLDLPADPYEWARVLRTHPAFERLALVEEDRKRAEYYAADQERRRLEESLPSREDFYRSLQQVVEIAPLDAATLPRIAQLTQKTNQFNLTTRRYTEQQLAEMSACSDWHVFSLRVRDRYADNGLVGAAILARREHGFEIDTLLLSCRVIARTVETAFASWLADWARAAGADSLEGWFYPTAKNPPASGFYAEHGFRKIAETTEGTQWSLDLTSSKIVCPEWIKLETPEVSAR